MRTWLTFDIPRFLIYIINGEEIDIRTFANEELIDWLIDFNGTAYQLLKGYFILRGYGIAFIVYLYLHCCFLRVFDHSYIFCLLCLGHLRFLLSSHINLKKESFHRTYILIIQYTDQILLSKLSDSFLKCHLKVFFLSFFKPSNLILIF